MVSPCWSSGGTRVTPPSAEPGVGVDVAAGVAVGLGDGVAVAEGAGVAVGGPVVSGSGGAVARAIPPDEPQAASSSAQSPAAIEEGGRRVTAGI